MSNLLLYRDALERASSYPSDRSSVSRSPVPSVRSVRSLASIPGSSASGSSSTKPVPPLANIPDVHGDNQLSHRGSIASARQVTSDDGAISQGGLIYPEQTAGRLIAPSRSSSIR